MNIVKSQSVIRPRQEDYYDIIASLIFIFFKNLYLYATIAVR